MQVIGWWGRTSGSRALVALEMASVAWRLIPARDRATKFTPRIAGGSSPHLLVLEHRVDLVEEVVDVIERRLGGGVPLGTLLLGGPLLRPGTDSGPLSRCHVAILGTPAPRAGLAPHSTICDSTHRAV